MFAVHDRAPKFEPGRVIAAGEYVCTELTARAGKPRSGLTHENDCTLLFVLRGGPVREIREFLDPVSIGPLAAEVMRCPDNAITS